jgi:hypothetical protein
MEKQELYCHGCQNYVQFELDISISGNHVLDCPKCGHEHCRVVENGKITGDRWDSRNKNVVYISDNIITWTASSTYDTYISGNGTSSTNDNTVFYYNAWLNTTKNN